MVYPNDKKRLPPQAFRGTTEWMIEAEIRNMATKLFDHARKPFEAMELMHLSLDPQYHSPMQVAFAENRGGDLNQHLYFSLKQCAPPDVETSGFIEFAWNYSEVPNGFFPRYMSGGSPSHPVDRIPIGIPSQVRDKFYDISEKLCRISYEWGLIRRVFKELNQPTFCTTPQQMRYLWPPILPILKHTKHEDEWVRILQEASPRAGDRARAPAEVQPVLRESYQAMTRALLILENPVENRMGPIRYNVDQPKFRRHGLEFEGMTATL